MKPLNSAPYSTGAFTEAFAGCCLIAATAADTLCVCSTGFLLRPPRRFFLATGGGSRTTHSGSDSSLASRPYESSSKNFFLNRKCELQQKRCCTKPCLHRRSAENRRETDAVELATVEGRQVLLLLLSRRGWWRHYGRLQKEMLISGNSGEPWKFSYRIQVGRKHG